MNNRNAFETETDVAVGVDNRGFVLCFPPAQKQVETRMYQNRLRSARVKEPCRHGTQRGASQEQLHKGKHFHLVPDAVTKFGVL